VNHASLFSGIGGFDLAAEWMGWKNVFNCEWEEFPRQVLKHHFPNAIQHGDIKELDATTYAGRIDILTGGFPCQPYSLAGKRKGKEDERHLWPEMLRVIRECSPRYVVGENVRGLVGWNGGLVFEEVCADLEAQGYAVQPFVLPAAGVGSCPHRRDRVWFVANSGSTNGKPIIGREWREQSNQRNEVRSNLEPISEERTTSNSDGIRLEHRTQPGSIAEGKREIWKRIAGQSTPTSWTGFPTVPPVCGGDDGLPKELDGITFSKWRRESIKAYGNAIVPQVALQIFKAINLYENGAKL
jgi:DNA (cytosine-5)-methyltransferase 1